MKEYLFSYGTLQKQEVQWKLYGRYLSGEKDVLNGYKTSAIQVKDLTFLAKGEAATQQTLHISDDKTNAVAGTIFELTQDELLQTDAYEPENYKRIKMKFASGKEAWVYLAEESK
jgi:gamma-glutamylcyclotransferase (GGCT)/AIG2-like uncharacterized protein YtfP